jgi:hypothetical protein
MKLSFKEICDPEIIQSPTEFSDAMRCVVKMWYESAQEEDQEQAHVAPPRDMADSGKESDEEASRGQGRQGRGQVVWFRGQPRWGDKASEDDPYDLVPGVYRKDTFGSHDERQIGLAFRLLAKSRYPNCPDMTDFASWLFLMQHYRLPTRLLDWSASPFVALFFAVEERRYIPGYRGDKFDADIFALRPVVLNYFADGDRRNKEIMEDCTRRAPEYDPGALVHDATWIDPWDPDYKDLFAAPFRQPPGSSGADPDPTDSRAGRSQMDDRDRKNEGWRKGRILAIRPLELDPRVAAQASRFTIHETNRPLNEHWIARSILRWFRIRDASRDKFMSWLEHANVRRSTLFPELDSLSIDLRRYGRLFDMYRI